MPAFSLSTCWLLISQRFSDNKITTGKILKFNVEFMSNNYMKMSNEAHKVSTKASHVFAFPPGVS